MFLNVDKIIAVQSYFLLNAIILCTLNNIELRQHLI